MFGELGRAATARTKRLEDAVAELEPSVEHGQHGLRRIDDPAVDPDVAGVVDMTGSTGRPAGPT